MPLLDLPPEILQVILQYCTTPSFLQAALSCRALFSLASDSRSAVLHHLDLTPGLLAGSLTSQTPSTSELFFLLKKRAAAYLYGTDIHADCNTFVPRSGSIDPRACALRQDGDPNIAVVERGKPDVHLYRLVAGAIEPVCKLTPPPEYVGIIEVLRVVFAHDKNTISVLVRYEPNAVTASNPVHPYVKEALGHFRESGIHLIHYRREEPGKPFSYITLTGFADHEVYTIDHPNTFRYTRHDGVDNNYEPLAIDVANPFRVAICWRHNRFHNMRKIVLHTAPGYESDPLVQKLTSFKYESTTIVDPTGFKPGAYAGLPNLNFHGPVVKVRFNDRCSQLLYYHPSVTVYCYYQLVYLDDESDIHASNIHRNIGNVLYELPSSEDDPGRELPFDIDIPIFCTHETYIPGPNHAAMCHWQYLSLGIGADRQEGKSVAALLRSEARCRSFRCGHSPNLERGRRLEDWTMVARLLDYEPNSSSSLAGTTASSPGGTRLAVTTWKTIRIWAFDPREIITGNANNFYPSGLQHRPGVIDIEPIVLCPDAVIFSLCFVGEDELVCVTDKGVMRWNLGPLSRGERGVGLLLPETEAIVDDEPATEYLGEESMDNDDDDDGYDEDDFDEDGDEDKIDENEIETDNDDDRL